MAITITLTRMLMSTGRLPPPRPSRSCASQSDSVWLEPPPYWRACG
jgi:hypothetical protein